MTPQGEGHATLVRTVSVRQAEREPQTTPRGSNIAPLGRDGKPAGDSLPSRPTTGSKPAPGNPLAQPGRPNVRPGGAVPQRASMPLRLGVHNSSPTTVNLNIQGMTQGTTNCGNCQPPDPNAAVSTNEIAHVVNLRLQVRNKMGGLACATSLATLAGTGAQPISDPHVQWDNVSNRFSLVFIPVPTTDTAIPTEYLLATRTADACGAWYVYTVTFSGSLYPPGALLDYPYLGQDNTPTPASTVGGAILSSTNNFCCSSTSFGTYIGSAAFSVPKHLVYAGQGFSFPAFGVSFSTAPVTVGGVPTPATANTYWLASVPGSGYNLYVMTNSSQPGTTLALQAAVSAPFNPPSRRVNQPGTTQTLDPLDGRIVWTPTLSGGFIWFTHGIDLAGFPSIRYGAISTATNAITTAIAYHSGTSDDFNPSISVFPEGGSLIYGFLNWAYTDPPAGVPTSDTMNGVLPGTGVPTLTGTDSTLVTGAITNTNFRFGDFSSVEIDPVAAGAACPLGQTAVMSNEYFTDGRGDWATRVARVSFC